ncbi:MAG: hypothetical protein SVZ03_00065 [Spirochaetota bacterium]|nr:hypothetical protein [Spirochaetota bacterium]
MFDIEEYYKEYNIQDASHIQIEIDDIESYINNDIDNLLKNRFDKLYLRDKFKYNKSGIDIIYPRISYNANRSLVKGADHIRFLLSLYPRKGDLDNIEKIVLRPRHVEVENIELMSLYIRRRRILVIYLHHPHLYSLKNSKFGEYSEFLPLHLPGLFDKELFENSATFIRGADIKISSLWYIISIISYSPDNKIDKFLIRNNNKNDRVISKALDEISFYYSRHGY